MNAATAAAHFINTVAREEFHAYGLELNYETQRTYLPAVSSLHAHATGPRRVVASVTGPRFGYVAGDALDKAYANLFGSPHEIPEGGRIDQIGPNTWEMAW